MAPRGGIAAALLCMSCRIAPAEPYWIEAFGRARMSRIAASPRGVDGIGVGRSVFRYPHNSGVPWRPIYSGVAMHIGASPIATYVLDREHYLHLIPAKGEERRSDFSSPWQATFVLDPSVQSSCLHDIHANYIAVPALLGALGLMEARRPYWALLVAFLTCICREETGVYAAAAGLFWALGGSRDRTRIRIGWVTVLMAASLLLLITRVVMPRAGGNPRYQLFTYYYDSVGMGAVLKSYALNPLGAVKLLSSSMRLEYLWLSLLPFGFLACLGWRAAWFLLIPMGIQLPARVTNFWAPGVGVGSSAEPRLQGILREPGRRDLREGSTSSSEPAVTPLYSGERASERG